MSDLVAELNDLWFMIQTELEPSVSVEAGAFRAEFSQKIKNMFPGIVAFAYEANPYTFEQEKQNLADQGIYYINNALSDKVGDIDFLIQDAYLDHGKVVTQLDPIRGNNSLIIRTEKDVQYKPVTVQGTTLDQIFVEQHMLSIEDRFCLWIDVEGASDKVLLGATEMLKKVQSIFIEVEEFEFWKDQWLAKDVISFLEDQGFEYIARDNEYEKQYNCIFVKKELMEQVEGLVLWWEDHYGS
jgi:FkbM family methyltransferase